MTQDLFAQGRWFGPVDTSVIEGVEAELKVDFPLEYRQFIERYGRGIIGSTEIYGLGGDESSRFNVLNVIRNMESLSIKRPPILIPISPIGNGDYSAILAEVHEDLAQGTVVFWSPRPDEILDVKKEASSFAEWVKSL